MKVAFFVTEDHFFLSHRLPMARAARDAGYDVCVVANDTGRAQAVRDLGFDFIALPARRSSINPLGIFWVILRIIAILRTLRPDLVHNVALKPICLVGLSSFFSPYCRYLHAVTGLGTVFVQYGPRMWLVRFALCSVLRWLSRQDNHYFLFQNSDDLNDLRRRGLRLGARATIIRGSGVDTDHFCPLPEPEGERFCVGFAGRMLVDKGVRELRAAHRLVRARGVPLNLLLAGQPDPRNLASLSPDDMADWAVEDGVHWLGQVDDIKAFWARVHVAVLPSYREGLPLSLLEAAACGRALIATDVPGCREIAQHEITALIVPVKEITPLAEAIIRLAQDHTLRQSLAQVARAQVEAHFSAHIIARELMALYARILADKLT